MDVFPNTGPHLHIVLNHFPLIGSVFVLGLLIASAYMKNDDMRRVSLILFVVLGLLAIPTYITGAAAGWAYQGRPDMSVQILDAHRDAALMAFVFIGLTGLVSWLVLWRERRYGRASTAGFYAVLALGIVALLTIVEAGSLGGTVLRPELREGAMAEPIGLTAAIESAIQSIIWAWPSMEAAHFVGMAVLFGVVLLVGLRVLGVARNVPYSAVHRLLPLGALALLVNIITGMFFFIADSGRYVAMDGFPPKIIWLMVGGLAIIYFTIFDDIWDVKSDQDAPPRAKVMAALTMVSWAAVLVFGRLLPYYGEGG
jgi:uncharacterized membrane protein